jgi:hypothetical protein
MVKGVLAFITNSPSIGTIFNTAPRLFEAEIDES